MDLAEPHLRLRSVGSYYLIRSLAITPAAFVGGLLWHVAPPMPFHVARAIRHGWIAAVRAHGR